MTVDGTPTPERNTRRRSIRPVGYLVARWLLLAAGVWTLRLLAHVALPGPGGNIADLQASRLDVAASGLLTAVFVVVAVGGRIRWPSPVWLVAVEALAVGFLAVWPDTNSKAFTLLNDSRLFDYQTLAAIWFAGAVTGVVGALRRRRPTTETA